MALGMKCQSLSECDHAPVRLVEFGLADSGDPPKYRQALGACVVIYVPGARGC